MLLTTMKFMMERLRIVSFYDFMGFNSDGIDIGEGCKNIKIDSVIIYNITDKGISVGQKSSASINQALIFNTGIGVAVKDSSWARIKNSTFYNNRQGCGEL